jgi:hypothetical protein
MHSNEVRLHLVCLVGHESVVDADLIFPIRQLKCLQYFAFH